MQESLHEIVRTAEQNFLYGTTTFGKYVEFNTHETIERITAYLNSKHTSGDKDSLGRDKPFFNIVSAAVNIWYRATDIDRKDIIIKPDKTENVGLAFVATVHLQEWMKRERFGTFLNQWGRVLAQYGSSVVKFVDKGGKLIPTVIPWNRLIVDPVDFEALPRIEKLYKTPAQLLKIKEYDKKAVKSLIESRNTRKTLDGQQKDTQNEFIELYEVHGELPLAVLKAAKGETVKDSDNDEYVQQMHVLSYVQTKDGKTEDFTLYSGRESKDPYIITHLIEEEGRTLSIGAVEYLFDAQWMKNHTMKAWKDQMDIASMLIWQTADPNFVGRNSLTQMQTGDFVFHGPNTPIERFPNEGHDITSLQAFGEQWRVLAQELTSTPDSFRGTNPPSGTPLGTTQLLNQNAGSLFEIMTENKGLALEEMLRTWVIPFLKTKMDTSDEIVTTLSEHDIKRIDAMYVPRAAVKQYNERTKEKILNGENVEQFNQVIEESGVQQGQSSLGNMRSFIPSEISSKTWNDVLEGLEWELEVGITNESYDKQTALTTLSTVLQTIASNPNILLDPTAKMLFNRILTETGTISPLEIASMPPSQPIPQPTPMVGASN